MRLLATYELPFPPSVNTYWRKKHGQQKNYISEAGKAFRENVMAAVWARGGYKPAVIRCNVKLCIGLWPPDKRIRDIDNTLKAPLDALVHAGVLEDDRQVVELNIRMNEPDGKGLAVVKIFEVLE